jgi:hypothetical protein
MTWIIGFILVALKLAGVIHWDWIWVTLPLWIDFAFAAAVYLLSEIQKDWSGK